MKLKGAILADDAVDGPHPSDLIAPAGGPAGEGDDRTTDALQSFDRRACDGGGRLFVVNVSSMSVNTTRFARRASG